MSLIEFKGKIYDTEKYYVFYSVHLVKVISTDGRVLHVEHANGGKGEMVNHHLNEVALVEPERVKIVPKHGNLYLIRHVTGGYLGASFFNSEDSVFYDDADMKSLLSVDIEDVEILKDFDFNADDDF